MSDANSDASGVGGAPQPPQPPQLANVAPPQPANVVPAQPANVVPAQPANVVPPQPANLVFNPPQSFADFNFASRSGFHYTEDSFNRQVAARQNRTEPGYQQREAFPRPDGVSHSDWKKAFNSADSSVYHQVNDVCAESLNIRQNTHQTRVIAEQKLKARLLGNGQTVPGPDPPGGPILPAAILPSGNNSNNQPGQQRPSSSNRNRNRNRNRKARKNKPREKKVTFQDQPASFASREVNQQPRRFQPARGSRRAVDYTESDEDEDDKPLSPPEAQQVIEDVVASFDPGERNRKIISDPNNHRTPYNNLTQDHTRLRANQPVRSTLLGSIASYTFGTGLGSNPRNLPEAPLSTGNPNIGAGQTTFGEHNPSQGFQHSGTDLVQNNSSSLFVDDDDDDVPDLTDLLYGPNPNIGGHQGRTGDNNPFGRSQTSNPDAEHRSHDYSGYFPRDVHQQSLTTNTSGFAGVQPQFSFTGNGPTFEAPPPPPPRRSRFGDWDGSNTGAQQAHLSTGGPRIVVEQQQPPSSSRLWEDSNNLPGPSVADNSNLVAQQPPLSLLGEISSNLPGPQPFTNPEKGMQNHSSFKIDSEITYNPSPAMDNSKTSVQKTPSPNDLNNANEKPPSKEVSKIGGDYTGGHSASENSSKKVLSNKNHVQSSPKSNNPHVQPSPKNKSGKHHVQPSSKNSSKSAQQPTSSKGNSKVATQKPSSSENNLKNAQGQSYSKGNPKLATKQSSSSLGSKSAVQPPSRKAKMSSQAKKQKGKADYCVCKQIKHGTKMIACEGGCENWFHVSCVKILCADTDGVATFICDDCPGKTTYKRLCRLEGCNRPHSTSESVGEDGRTKVVPSKYCSLEHRNEYWARQVAEMEPQFTSELRSYLEQTPRGEFKTAGDQPTRAVRGVQHGGTDPSDGFAAIGPPHNDVGMNSLDFREREGCRKNIARISETVLHYENRAKLVAMLKKYSDETTKKYAEENKIVESAPKRAKDNKSGKSASHTICGYDPRIVVTDKWIDQYMATPEGDAAWKSGVIGEHTNPDFPVDVEPEYYKGVCVKTKCQRHGEWYVLRKEECDRNLEWGAEDLAVENKKLAAQIERVQLRLAIEREREQYAQERAAEMTPENKAGFLREWTTLLGDKNIILKQLLKKYQTSSTMA